MGSGASKARSKKTGAPAGKSIKVPLHIAVQAVVLIQSRIRVYLAKKRLFEMQEERKMHESKAADYVRTLKTKNDKNTKKNNYLTRRSWSAEDDAISSLSENTMFRVPAHLLNSNKSHGSAHQPSPNSKAVPMSMSSKMSQRFFPSQPQQPVNLGDISRNLAGAIGDNAGSRFANTTFGRFGGAAKSQQSGPILEEIIYPFVGFVIKTKINATDRKFFINVTHSPRVQQMLASPVRSWTDCTHHDEEGLLLAVEVSIVDVVIPTKDFETLFVYKENVGTIPVNDMSKTDLAIACIDYINHLFSEIRSQEKRALRALQKENKSPSRNHRFGSYDEEDEEEEDEDKDEEEDEEDDLFCSRQFKLPRIKRNYVGAIVPLCLQPASASNNATSDSAGLEAAVDGGMSVSFLEPFKLSLNLPDHLPSIDDLVFPPEIAQDMALSWSSITDMRLLPTKLAAAATAAAKGTSGLSAALLAMHLQTSYQTRPANTNTTTLSKQKSTDPYNLDDDESGPAKNKNRNGPGDDDEEEEDKELESHQREYLEALHKFKIGFKIYVEVQQGILYIFKRRSAQHRALLPSSNPNKDGGGVGAVSNDPVHRVPDPIPLTRPLPGGDDELARISLAAVDLTPECDAQNDLFFLHIDLLFPLAQTDAEGLTKRGRKFQRDLVRKTHLKNFQLRKKKQEKKKLKRRMQRLNGQYDSDDESEEDEEDDEEEELRLFTANNNHRSLSTIFLDGDIVHDDENVNDENEDLYYEEMEDDNKERNFGPVTLHHEALSETLTATHARHITRIAQHFLHPQRLTLQFHSHAELMAWMLYFEQHVFYVQQTMPRYFAPQNPHHYASVITQPIPITNSGAMGRRPREEEVDWSKYSGYEVSSYNGQERDSLTNGNVLDGDNSGSKGLDGPVLAQRLAEQDTLYVPAQRGRKPSQSLSLGALGPAVPVTPARERILVPHAHDHANKDTDLSAPDGKNSSVHPILEGKHDVHTHSDNTANNNENALDADALLADEEETKQWQEELQALLSPEVARAKTDALLQKLSCLKFRGAIPLTSGPPQAYGCYVQYRARQPPKPLFRSARESAKITSFMAGIALPAPDTANSTISNSNQPPNTAGSSASSSAVNSNGTVGDVELLPGPRAMVYMRVDRGFLLLYENEALANTVRAREHLGHNALLVLSLQKQRLSVRHRKIVRMRNYMSRFTLRSVRIHPPQLSYNHTNAHNNGTSANTFGAKNPKRSMLDPNNNSGNTNSSSAGNSSNKIPASLTHRRIDIVRELFLRSAGGATDDSVRLLHTRLQEHMHYADAQLQLSRLGVLDDAQILDYALRHVDSSHSTTAGENTNNNRNAEVQVIDCDVSVTLPLPDATSDDDSDLEDIPLKPGIIERFFRVVKPPPAALFAQKEEDLLHAWKEQLIGQYSVFPGMGRNSSSTHNSSSISNSNNSQTVLFPCTLMLFTEAKILCVFHEMTLFSVLSVRRCLEKVMTKRDRLAALPETTTPNKAHTTKLRSLQSNNISSSGSGSSRVGASNSSSVTSHVNSHKRGVGVGVGAKAAVSKLYDLDSSSSESDQDDDNHSSDNDNNNNNKHDHDSDRDYEFEPDPLLMLLATTAAANTNHSALTLPKPLLSTIIASNHNSSTNNINTNNHTSNIITNNSANNNAKDDRKTITTTTTTAATAAMNPNNAGVKSPVPPPAHSRPSSSSFKSPRSTIHNNNNSSNSPRSYNNNNNQQEDNNNNNNSDKEQSDMHGSAAAAVAVAGAEPHDHTDSTSELLQNNSSSATGVMGSSADTTSHAALLALLRDEQSSEDEHLGRKKRRTTNNNKNNKTKNNSHHYHGDDSTNNNHDPADNGHDHYSEEDSDEEAEQEVLDTLTLLQFQLTQRRQSASNASNNSSSSTRGSTTTASAGTGVFQNHHLLLPKIKQYFIELLAYDRRTYRFHFHGRDDYHLWLRIVQPHWQQRAIRHHGNSSIAPVSAVSSPFRDNNSSTTFPSGSSSILGHNNGGKEHSLSRAEYANSNHSGHNGGGSNNGRIAGGLGMGLSFPPLLTANGGLTNNNTISSKNGVNGNNNNNNNNLGSSKLKNALTGRELLFTIDQEATKKYIRVLRAAEKVLGSGQVWKYEKSTDRNGPKQRRILLVTDAPRLVFIDSIGAVARGQVDLAQEAKMELRNLDNGDFEVVVAGTAHRFATADSPEKDAKFWFTRIRQAVAKLN